MEDFDSEGVTEMAEPRAQARPWPRFWARLLDMSIYLMPLMFITGYLFPDFVMLSVFDGRGGSLLLGALLLPAAMLLDAIVLTVFGNSLAKFLMGIRAETIRHERFDFGTALNRNFQVWLKGVGLGIPIVALIQYSINHSKVSKGNQTSWDDSLFTRVYDINNTFARTFTIAIMYLALNVGGAVLDAMDAQEARQMPSSPEWGEHRQRPDPIAQQLITTAAEIQPQQLDEITHLDSASAEARTLTYHYTITRRDAPDDAIVAFFEKTTVPKVCKDKNMASDMKTYNIIYQYSYSVPDTVEPLLIVVDRGKCAALGF